MSDLHQNIATWPRTYQYFGFAEKAPEKSAEELQLEEFLFGKDIINAPQKDEEEEIEVTWSSVVGFIHFPNSLSVWLCRSQSTLLREQPRVVYGTMTKTRN